MMSEKPWFAHYEPTVPRTIEIPRMALHELLTASAKKYPANVAVHMLLKYLPLGLAIQSKLTYRELDEAVDRFAAALQSVGVQKGDRVAIMLPNIPQQVVAYFGTARAGAIVVNTNPTYTTRELHHQLADSGAKVIVMLSGLYDRLTPIRDKTAIEQIIIADVPDTLHWPFSSLVAKQVRSTGLMKALPAASDLHHFDALLKRAPRKPTAVAIDPDDVVLFQYSGGTTGTPKAAMLTNYNLVANTMQMRTWFTSVEDGKERLLGALPFFHVYGMTVTMLFAVATGGKMVLVPDPRNTNHVLDVIQNEKITLYPGVPGMYIGIINHPKVKEYDLHSIKACLSGGAALPVEVAQRFKEITGGNLVEGFGMTESSPVATANPINGESRAGSIGLPLPNTDVRIVSLVPDENNEYTPLAVGEEGEIVVKGPQVMKGYWNRAEESANTVDADGWLHTGDIAKQDEDGYFYIVDRKKDLIIASGYNIVPREVEEVLFMHPKVQEAAVAGVPDPKRGETVKAYIVLKQGEQCNSDEIRTFCKENLAPYKVPTLVEFRAELPKTQIGKVLRRVLVEEEKQKQQESAKVPA
jgi:long-chain acyl-CoA synthetase